MHAHQDVRFAGNVAMDQRDVLGSIDIVAVSDNHELAELGGNPSLGHAMYQLLDPEAIRDQLSNRHKREPMLMGDFLQLRTAGHRAISIENLADDAGRIESRESGEIHACFGLAYPLENTAGPRPERKDVAGATKIRGDRGRIDGDVYGGGAIAGGDTGGDAEAPLRVDADGECGRQLLGIPLGHLRQAELVAALTGERQTDEAPAVEGHEVDHFRRGKLGGADEIPLVLTILIIGHDDDFAVPQVVDGLLDGPECRHTTPGTRER
jgi:hypothetical protein